jgi:hypothetical protein
VSGYTKLFSSILQSTVWQEPSSTKVVWITMLALAGKTGVVEGSIPGLAHTAGVTIDECEEALRKFKSPDPYSRSKDFEGRRVAEVDGGWRVLNHGKYRELLSKENEAEANARRQKRYREKNRHSNGSVTVRNGSVTQNNAIPDPSSDASSSSIPTIPQRSNTSVVVPEREAEKNLGSAPQIPAAPPATAKGDGGRTEPPPPKPKRNGTDPRFAPLRAAFEAEFLAATGQPYRWQGAKDAKALHTLIAVPVEDFRAKAQAGLRANGFPRSPTVSQLAAKWNDLTIATGPPARQPLSHCKPWDDLLEHARSNGGRETAKWLLEYVSPRVEDKTLVLEAPDQCRADYVKRHLAGIESAALERFGLAIRLVVGKTCHH